MSDSPVRAAYTAWAATYDTDRNRTRDLDRAVASAVLAGRRYRAVLEIGCGTGKNTPLYAQIGDRVLAVDFSEGMLAQARAKGLGDRVVFARADLTRPWPCAGGSVDLIACNLVLEHIADLAPIFAEAARTLAPAGQFFICELHPFKQYLGSRARFERDARRVEPPAFVHHLADFFAAATRAGFALADFREWWHDTDADAPPRLVSLLFTR